MGTRRRSNGELARDRRRISDLYLKGWIQADIGVEVGLHQSTVSRDIKWLQDEWIASALVDFNEARARELARIDTLEREYWDAWQRSKEDAEVVTTKGKGTKETAASVEKTVQRRGRVGDASFLRGVEWCITRRCKLMGLDEPSRFEVDWREEAKEAGLDPAEVFEQYVAAAAMALDQSADTE